MGYAPGVCWDSLRVISYNPLIRSPLILTNSTGSILLRFPNVLRWKATDVSDSELKSPKVRSKASVWPAPPAVPWCFVLRCLGVPSGLAICQELLRLVFEGLHFL